LTGAGGQTDEVTLQRCVESYKATFQRISDRNLTKDIGKRPMEDRTVGELDWHPLRMEAIRASWELPFRA
jgi:hypothetical protein